MQIYFDKLRKILKKRAISQSMLCRELGISRMALWNWENKKNTPSEDKIRNISNILNICVTEISDLKAVIDKSDKNLSENLKSWLELAGKVKKSEEREEKMLNGLISNLQMKLRQASVLVRAFTDSTKAIFYVKDLNSKYILANEAFLNMVSIKPKSNIVGLDDYAFFNKQEAKDNFEEDCIVLVSGKSIDSLERYLPGSR